MLARFNTFVCCAFGVCGDDLTEKLVVIYVHPKSYERPLLEIRPRELQQATTSEALHLRP
jgi:hypothetical protein